MKQIKFFWFALAAVFSFAACSRADGSEISVPPDSSQYGTEADVEDSADEIPLEVPAKVVRGKVILQPQGKEFFT